jgi:hypothetical protein
LSTTKDTRCDDTGNHGGFAAERRHRHRPGKLADQQGGIPDLRDRLEFAGAQRRRGAAILDQRIPALQFDAERKAAEALLVAAINAPGIRLAAAPFVQRRLRLGGGEIPEPGPTGRQ